MRTGFDPARHGFRFANRFVWPARAWGWALAQWGLRLAHLQADALGLCGGMCLAALDYYHAGQPIPADDLSPQPGSPLFRYLLQRQLDSYAGLRLPWRVLRWMWRRDRVLERWTLAEFERLRLQLDAGAPTPLVLLRTSGLADPTANHQVLAIGYTWEPLTRRATISLYDPNHPRAEPTLTFTISLLDGRVSELSQSTGEPLRGFCLGYYHPRSAPPQ